MHRRFQKRYMGQIRKEEKMNLKTIKDRIAAILADKLSGIRPEVQNKVAEIVKRIEDLLSSNNGECDIPDELIKEIAKCLIPDIIKFLESDKGKEEYNKWIKDSKNSEKALKSSIHME